MKATLAFLTFSLFLGSQALADTMDGASSGGTSIEQLREQVSKLQDEIQRLKEGQLCTAKCGYWDAQNLEPEWSYDVRSVGLSAEQAFDIITIRCSATPQHNGQTNLFQISRDGKAVRATPVNSCRPNKK